jgi:microcystin-dependent protein
MASTWSALKVELLETGANAGQWGNLTNANLGDAVLGEAITGQATVNFATDADVTITLTDSASTQAARNLRLNITESSTGIGSVRNLILGSGCQIEKFYLINNTGTGAKTVKNTSGTGISVPAGKATLVFNNGTDVVDAASYFTSLTLGSALPITSGGTGTTSTTFANLTTNVTGLLPVANGGTGTATPALVQGSNVTITGTWPNQTIAAAAPGTGTVTSVGGTGTVNGISLSGSVTTSGNLTLGGTLSGVDLTSQVTGTLPIANGGTGTTSTTFVNAATNVTGTLPVANGGTGATTLTANNVLLGNGTSAPLFVAPGSSGNILTSDGSTWASTAPAGGVPVGTEALWPTNTPPTGWLQENGASLSRTGTYAALFAVIGTTYGTANGSSFNLPDARGRFVRVWNNGAGIDPDAGSRTIPATSGATMSAGDNVGTNQAQDVISHTHLIPGANAGVGSGSGGFPLAARNDSNIFTGAYGGSETRPVNTYRMMIIKY